VLAYEIVKQASWYLESVPSCGKIPFIKKKLRNQCAVF